MSMHLRGSRDMMRNENEGWWTSRSGLEQKLIILCTILFIVCFALTITVIVYKNRSSSGECTTVAPPITGSTPVTDDTSPISDSTVSSSTDVSTSQSPETSPTSPTPKTSPTSPTPEASPTSPTPEASPTPPTPETSPTPPTPETSPSPETPKLEEKAAVPIEKSESVPLIALQKEADRDNNILENPKYEGKWGGP